MPAGAHLPRLEVTSRGALRAWLEANGAQAGSVWLVTHKKAQGAVHVPYGDVVEELLAFGWIDSAPRKLDAARAMLLISPRRPGSAWSAANKERAARMEAAGLMTTRGRAAVEAARADGSWRFLETVDALEVPPDLAAALDAAAPAAERYAAFPPSAKRAILEWVLRAKRPETRAARIAEAAHRAQRGERAREYLRKPE